MIGRRAQKIGVKQPTTATGNGPLMKELQAGKLPTSFSGPKPTVDIPGGAGAMGGTRVPPAPSSVEASLADAKAKYANNPEAIMANFRANAPKSMLAKTAKIMPTPTPSGGLSGAIARGLGSAGTPPSRQAMMKKGGKVSSASKRADGIATKGKTRGKIV